MADALKSKKSRKMYGAKRASKKMAFSKNANVVTSVRNYAIAHKWGGRAVTAAGALITGTSGGLGGILGGAAMMLGGLTWAAAAGGVEGNANNRIGVLKRGAVSKRASINSLITRKAMRSIASNKSNRQQGGAYLNESAKKKAAKLPSRNRSGLGVPSRNPARTGGARGFANKKTQAAAQAARRRKGK